MKRNARVLLTLFFILNWSGTAILAGGQEGIKEKASAAIKSADYSTAISLCLQGLRQNPRDDELNFLLSRGYAYSGRWDEALRILDNQALVHPENIDVRLFRARIISWKKNYGQAESGYNEVLGINPGNADALIGLAEIASWQGDLAKALSIYGEVREQDPRRADIYFRLGRVYLWEGNFARAQENLRKALSLDPGNKEYLRNLRASSPRRREKYELRYEHQADGFSDERGPYLDQNLALQLNALPKIGPLIFKYNHTDRFGQKDDRWGLELYPHLWKRAYGYLDLTYSSKALYFPKTATAIEVYQGILKAAEVSLGVRRLNFVSNPVTQYVGSLGYYFGNYYAYWRWYYSADGPSNRFAWLANLRRYFSEDSYIFAGYGRGTRPYDHITLEDFRAGRSWIFLAGFNWYFLRRIKLQAYYSLGDEAGLRRNTLFLSTGYRW
jgi:YaiO family outer membrane protein